MAQYMTAEQYATRHAKDVSEYSPERLAQLNAYLGDASALVDLAAKPVVIDGSEVVENGALHGLLPIIDKMVTRSLENPRDLTSEQIGDYMWQQVGSIMATKREFRAIRRLVGVPLVGDIQLEADIPLPPTTTGVLGE